MGLHKRMLEQEQMNENDWKHLQDEIRLADKLEIYINNKTNNNNMSIIAQPTNSSGGQTVPAGTHVARCYEIIHIGTIFDTFQGEERLVNKVRLVFELPLETSDFGKGEQPFSIGRDFTLSMHEKSGLRAFVQSWLGRSLSDSEAFKFDISTLLGKEAMVSVMHRTAISGRVYADLKAASPLAKGMLCPPQVNMSFLFDYDSPNFDSLFKSLPEWLQNKVSSSKEFSDRLERSAASINNAKQMLEAKGLVSSNDVNNESDDMPF
jgi:hypothetical protein